MKYCVKLYGNLSDDKDRFARDLAEVLHMDAAEASSLMDNVPVVVLSGLSKNRAEQVARDLAAIRALYLIEPEGEEPEPQEPQKPLIDVLPEPRPQADTKENLRHGFMGMAALLAVVAVVLIVGSVSLFSIFKKMRAENPGPELQPKVEEPSSQDDADSARREESEIALRARIETLESRNEQLKSLIRLKQDEVRRGTSSYSMDFNAVRQSRQELGQLRAELQSNVREIKELDLDLRRLVPPKPDRFQ